MGTTKAKLNKKTNKKADKASEKPFFSNTKLHYIIIVITVFILYINSIPNEYSLDDIYVTNNEQVTKGFKAIPEIFTGFYATNVYDDGKQLNFGYRPLVKVTYAIEYQFFGNNPHVSHFINLLLYLLTIILLFSMLRKWLKSSHPIIPLLIILLFAAHPLHTEVVSSLKNRDELLSFLGGLGALFFFIRFFEKGKIINVIVALLIFLLGVMSKFSAAAFVMIIPLVLYFFYDIKLWKLGLVFLSLLAIAFLFMLVPHSFLPIRFRPQQFVENPLLSMDKIDRIPTAFYILFFYLKMIIFPHPMKFYYGFNEIPVQNWGDYMFILSFLFYLSIFVYAIWQIRRKTILSFSILFFLLNMSLYTNVFRPAMGIVADRFMYSSSLGVIIAFVYLLFMFIKSNKLKSSDSVINRVIFICLIVLIAYSVKTIDRNKDWKDQKTLVKHDIKYLANSAKANFIYGGMLKDEFFKSIIETKKRPPKAVTDEVVYYLEQAIKIYPEYYQAYTLLGSYVFTLYGDEEKAIRCYKEAISLNANSSSPYYSLGYLYFLRKDYKNAEVNLRMAYEISPDNDVYLSDLIGVYSAISDTLNVQKYSNLLEKLQRNKNMKKSF